MMRIKPSKNIDYCVKHDWALGKEH